MACTVLKAGRHIDHASGVDELSPDQRGEMPAGAGLTGTGGHAAPCGGVVAGRAPSGRERAIWRLPSVRCLVCSVDVASRRDFDVPSSHPRRRRCYCSDVLPF